MGLSLYLALTFVDMIISLAVWSADDRLKKALTSFYLFDLHPSTYHSVRTLSAKNNGASSFDMACQNGHLTVVQALLQSDRINYNQAGPSGATPFFMACLDGHITVVQELLQSGKVDCNKAMPAGPTPFYMACQNGHLTMVEVLLKSGNVDYNKAMSSGATPFYIACQNGHLAVVEVLLQSGRINCNQVESRGITPFFIACHQGHLAVVQMLLQNDLVDCSQAMTNGTTPLFNAYQKGHFAVVRALLKSDRDKLVTFEQLEKMPTPEHRSALCSAQARRELKSKLLTPEKLANMPLPINVDTAFSKSWRQDVLNERAQMANDARRLRPGVVHRKIHPTEVNCELCIVNKVDTQMMACSHQFACDSCLKKLPHIQCPQCLPNRHSFSDHNL
jgi:ankyrin repeat protein